MLILLWLQKGSFDEYVWRHYRYLVIFISVEYYFCICKYLLIRLMQVFSQNCDDYVLFTLSFLRYYLCYIRRLDRVPFALIFHCINQPRHYKNLLIFYTYVSKSNLPKCEQKFYMDFAHILKISFEAHESMSISFRDSL